MPSINEYIDLVLSDTCGAGSPGGGGFSKGNTCQGGSGGGSKKKKPKKKKSYRPPTDAEQSKMDAIKKKGQEKYARELFEQQQEANKNFTSPEGESEEDKLRAMKQQGQEKYARELFEQQQAANEGLKQRKDSPATEEGQPAPSLPDIAQQKAEEAQEDNYLSEQIDPEAAQQRRQAQQAQQQIKQAKQVKLDEDYAKAQAAIQGEGSAVGSAGKPSTLGVPTPPGPQEAQQQQTKDAGQDAWEKKSLFQKVQAMDSGEGVPESILKEQKERTAAGKKWQQENPEAMKQGEASFEDFFPEGEQDQAATTLQQVEQLKEKWKKEREQGINREAEPGSTDMLRYSDAKLAKQPPTTLQQVEQLKEKWKEEREQGGNREAEPGLAGKLRYPIGEESGALMKQEPGYPSIDANVLFADSKELDGLIQRAEQAGNPREVELLKNEKAGIESELKRRKLI